MIAVLASLGFVLLMVQMLRAGRRGVIARACLLGALVLALLEPRISVEERTPENDIAVVLVDETTSQRIGERRQRSEDAASRIANELEAMPGMEVRTVTVGDDINNFDRPIALYSAKSFGFSSESSAEPLIVR